MPQQTPFRDKQIYIYVVVIFYIWILLEGIIRKWIFPTITEGLFFLKYGIIGIANLYFIMTGGKISFKSYPYSRILVFYLFYGVLEIVISFINYSYLIGILGYMIHFWFVFIPFILPVIITSKEQLQKISNWVLYLFLPIAILGVIQYYSSPDDFVNKYAVEEESFVNSIDGFTRVTGIFSFIAIYTSYINFCMIIAFVKLIQVNKITKNSLILFLVFGLGFINAFMTGSRGLIAILVLEFSAIGLILTFTSSSMNKFILYFLRFTLVSLLLYIILVETTWGSQAVATLMMRVSDTSDVENRIDDYVTQLKYFDKAGILGYGIGTAYQGASKLVPDWGDMPRGFEEESERIVLELGLFGYVLCILLRIGILMYSFRSYKIQKEPFNKNLILAIFIYLVPCTLFAIPIVYNWMENIIYWSLIGVIACINKMDKSHEPI